MPDESSFDPTIHAPARFRLSAVLRHVDAVGFGSLVKVLKMSESQLSKTIRSLAEVGYVTVTKGPSDGRDDLRHTTTVRLTELGRSAYDSHVAALHEIIAQRQVL
jgi:DNA-binding MarR family transcriptional regulator